MMDVDELEKWNDANEFYLNLTKLNAFRQPYGSGNGKKWIPVIVSGSI